MLLCSLQNSAVLNIQKRPRVTQRFGENPAMYKKFGLAGHNGLDYGVPEGTAVFAPMDGIIRVTDSGENGYGLHIKLRNSSRASEAVLGHLSKVLVQDGQEVRMGDKIGLSGNTGYSTAPHLHEGFRRLIPSSVSLWDWQVEDVNNGFSGYVDHADYSICWKGTLFNNTL